MSDDIAEAEKRVTQLIQELYQARVRLRNLVEAKRQDEEIERKKSALRSLAARVEKADAEEILKAIEEAKRG